MGLSFGLLNGESEEIVYAGSTTKDLYSRLNWDIKPLFYAGMDLDFLWKRETGWFDLFLGVNLKFCFPGYTGVTEDRDWIDIYENPTYPWLNLFSEHECYAKSGVLLDITVGMTMDIVHDLKLKFFLTYSLMSYSWLAKNGSVLYPPGYSPGHSELTGDGIEYKQVWNILTPGVSIYGSTNRYYDIEFFLKLSPFVWCRAVDDHLVKNTQYVDIMSMGFYIEPGFIVTYKPYSFLSFSVSFDYRYLGGLRGYTTIKHEGYPDIIDYGAGAAYSAVSIALAAKYTFF